MNLALNKTEQLHSQQGALPKQETRLRGRSVFLERAAILLIGLYLLTLPLMTHDIRAADEIEYFAYLHSLAFDGDLNFRNEYQYFFDRAPEKYTDSGFKKTFLDTITPTGLQPNFGPIGTAILWSPFYAVGHLVAVTGQWLGSTVPADGYSKPYLWAITFGSAFYALAGLLLSYALCRTLVGQVAAFWATLSVWLGTPVIFYSHLAPGYSHAASLFAVALFLFLWNHWRDQLTIRRAIALGIVGGLVAMIREQDALFLAVPALYAAYGVLSTIRQQQWQAALRPIGAILVVGISAIITYLPQLLTYQILNGVPRPNKDVSDKMNILSPNFWDVMTDPAHALPYWSPIVLVAIVGLLFLIRHNPRLGLALIIGFLLTWYINGAIKTWTTKGSFGARRFLNCTPIFVVGLAYAYERLLSYHQANRRLGRLLVPIITLLAIAWNGGLLIQFVLAGEWMSRQELVWPKNFLNQFRLIGHLPTVIRQLITDRGAFYEQ